jgi:Zn-dependent protease
VVLTSVGLLRLLINDPIAFVLLIIPLLYSVVIHEVAHGWVANRMGDPTAKLLGRLSLNPLKHLDPVGTLMLFLVGFGWAKPVPINMNNIADRRKGLIFVSSAGILANILLAFGSLLVYRLLSQSSTGTVALIANYTAYINITLAALNLIPIPPLDGSKILMGFASRNTQYFLARIEPYGFFILIALLYLGWLDDFIGFIRGIIVMIIKVLLP